MEVKSLTSKLRKAKKGETIIYDESGNPPKGWKKKVKKIMNPPKKKQECLKHDCPVCSKCQCEWCVMMEKFYQITLKSYVQIEMARPIHEAMREEKHD